MERFMIIGEMVYDYRWNGLWLSVVRFMIIGGMVYDYR